MNQTKNRIATGVCLSQWNSDVQFDCLGDAQKSFCMLRICQVDCRTGKTWIDNRFKEYAKACNKLSIPWVGYIYLQHHTVNTNSKFPNVAFMPQHDVWDVIRDVKFSLPYITIIFDFDSPDFDIATLNRAVHLFEKAIANNSDKKLTTCVGIYPPHTELGEHSEFRYPLYTEVYLPKGHKSFSIPNNAVLCWCGENDLSESYRIYTTGDKIELVKNRIGLDTIVALGEVAEAIYNYRGIE